MRKETIQIINIIKGSDKFTYTLTRRQSGKKVQWFPIKNERRFTKTLYSNKWAAERLVKDLVQDIGIERLTEIFA